MREHHWLGGLSIAAPWIASAWLGWWMALIAAGWQVYILAVVADRERR